MSNLPLEYFTGVFAESTALRDDVREEEDDDDEDREAERCPSDGSDDGKACPTVGWKYSWWTSSDSSKLPETLEVSGVNNKMKEN